MQICRGPIMPAFVAGHDPSLQHFVLRLTNSECASPERAQISSAAKIYKCVNPQANLSLGMRNSGPIRCCPKLNRSETSWLYFALNVAHHYIYFFDTSSALLVLSKDKRLWNPEVHKFVALNRNPTSKCFNLLKVFDNCLNGLDAINPTLIAIIVYENNHV